MTQVSRGKQATEPKSLLRAEKAFAVWRTQTPRSSRRRVPDRLWELASRLAVQEDLPIARICSRLKLNPESLRREIRKRSKSQLRSVSKKEPTFVSVPVPPLEERAPVTASDRIIEVEIVHSQGRRLRLCAVPHALRLLFFEMESPCSR